MTSRFATAAQPNPSRPGAAPQQTPAQPGPRPLRSVRAEPRSSRWVTTLGGFAFFIVAAVLFGLAVLNAVIVQQQRSIDEVSTDLRSAAAHNEQLQVELTRLEAPDRIMAVATEQLGMIAVEPSKVTYLTAARGELDPIFVASTMDAVGR